MTKLPPIVFFGSGPVAAATLEALWPHFAIEAIITKPRATGHRGSVPVLDVAHAHRAQVFTPQTKQELSDLIVTHSFTSQIGLVVDYGIIISKSVIDSFDFGIINSHFSLLPEWRGADPITFAVLSGQKQTGVSLMLINERLDEGQLLAQQSLALPANITTPELTTKLIALSNTMLITNIPKYIAGDIKSYDQPKATEASYSRKLTKDDAVIDIKKTSTQIEREIRAFSGWPKSVIDLFGHRVVVRKARIAQSVSDGALVITCGQQTFLEVLELTAPSGKTMSGAAFLRGYKK